MPEANRHRRASGPGAAGTVLRHAAVAGVLLAAGAAALAQTAGTVGQGAAAPAGRYGIGTPTTERAVAPWNIDVRADGAGLPPGRGSVAEGRAVYAAKCAACHGASGEGKPADALVGGRGTLTGDRPIKTVGSFWPYATTVYDFVFRAMPYTAPQSLTPAETYAVTAYLLHLNGIVGTDAVLDAASLPRVRMPNRDGFVADPRPDVGPDTGPPAP